MLNHMLNQSWWCQPNYTQRPTLSNDAPIGITFFSGGGGIDAGMILADINPKYAVEFDPQDPKLSARLADSHHTNFSDCRLIRRTVQDIARLNFPGFPRKPDYLHASPVCTNFSNAVSKIKGENQTDIDAAQAVAKAIEALAPRYFTLEQVAGYKTSESYKIILESLSQNGYIAHAKVINMADYGLPQNRRRLILRASKQPLPPLTPMYPKLTWLETIGDLLALLPSAELAPFQLPFKPDVDEPVILERHLQRYAGYETRCRVITNGLCHTLTKTKVQRGRWGNVVMPDGSVKDVTARATGRLQGFPDWYEFPSNKNTTGAIIGYSVPPMFAYQMFKSFEGDVADVPKVHGKPQERGSGRLCKVSIRKKDDSGRYLYKYEVCCEGKWTSKSKHVPKSMVSVVEEAIGRKTPVNEILNLLK